VVFCASAALLEGRPFNALLSSQTTASLAQNQLWWGHREAMGTTSCRLRLSYSMGEGTARATVTARVGEWVKRDQCFTSLRGDSYCQGYRKPLFRNLNFQVHRCQGPSLGIPAGFLTAGRQSAIPGGSAPVLCATRGAVPMCAIGRQGLSAHFGFPTGGWAGKPCGSGYLQTGFSSSVLAVAFVWVCDGVEKVATRIGKVRLGDSHLWGRWTTFLGSKYWLKVSPPMPQAAVFHWGEGSPP
jgi:hypothetical protein